MLQNQLILSVIIPIKDRENTLSRCLDSAISQTIKNIEIICVDDFSNDSSVKIVESYMEKDKRIKFIDRKKIKKNSLLFSNIKGVASTRNIGLNVAEGKYITFLDADDWIEENAYQKILDNCKEDIDMVIYAANIIDIDSILSSEDFNYTLNYYNPKNKGKVEVTDALTSQISTSLWNKVFKKSIIDYYDIRFPESLIFEDYEFVYKYLAHCKNVYFLQDKFYNYVQHNDSIMGKVRNRKFNLQFYSLLVFYNIYKHYEKYSLLEKYKHFLQNLFMKSYNDDLYFFVHSEEAKKDFLIFTEELTAKLDPMIVTFDTLKI